MDDGENGEFDNAFDDLLPTEEGDLIGQASDVEVMNIMFEQMIIPALIETRNQLFNLKYARNPDILNDAYMRFKEAILLTLDGDFPQVESVVSRIVNVANDNNLEFQKFPGGGSLQFQPNDLMISHKLIHAHVNSPQYLNKTIHINKPFYLDRIIELLQSHNIEKASRDCFINFFNQLPTILSKSFMVAYVQEGYRIAGITPPDEEIILSKCLRWLDENEDDGLDDYDRERILQEIPKEVERTSVTGVCTDDSIIAALGLNF